jgi:hypothetical protein
MDFPSWLWALSYDAKDVLLLMQCRLHVCLGHHGMARIQVADGGTASRYGG